MSDKINEITQGRTIWNSDGREPCLITEMPFNLRGEPLDNSPSAEGQARARAEAEAEQRKAQIPLFGEKPKEKTYDDKLHEPYTGRIPRGAHSHKCDKCGHRVACYKSRCTKGSRVELCGWCGGRR